MSRTTGALGKKTRVILDAVQSFVSPDNPVSVRYCLYRLISMGILESTTEYGNLNRLIMQARVRGDISDDCFVDNKRRTTVPSTWTSLQEYRQWCVEIYRRDYWEEQPNHVEVWLEKDTTSFIVDRTTREWGVPLRVSTGYFSRSFLYSIADELSDNIKPIYIFYIGDFDPSGLDIERCAREGNGLQGSRRREGLRDILLSQMAWTASDFDEQIHWQRIGIMKSDFDELPESAKVDVKQDGEDEDGAFKKGDPRGPAFMAEYGEFGAEVEALEVVQEGRLAQRVEDAIKRHIDFDIWNASIENEKRDRETLEQDAA